MRLKSGIWAAALVRRAFADGHFAAIERRGAEEAGALFVRVRHRDGSQSVFGPAPQSFLSEDQPGDRAFECRCSAVSEDKADALIERERRFDSDLWIVEIELDEPERYLTIVTS
jgi:hypothetical protein